MTHLDISYRSTEGKTTTRNVRVYITAVPEIVAHRVQDIRGGGTAAGWLLTHVPTGSSLGERFIYRTRAQALEAATLIAQAGLAWDWTLKTAPALKKHHEVVRFAFQQVSD